MYKPFPLFFLLFVITAGCTILSDEYLDNLPEDIVLDKIELSSYNYGEPTYILDAEWNAPVTYVGSTIQIDWPSGVDLFFYNQEITKTVYELNANGWAQKITNTFKDGTIMEDMITYNANDQVIALDNSFFNDHYDFFYVDNLLDSIAKTRTTPAQSGFYKLTSVDYSLLYYCIFPYDDAQPYQLDGFNCSAQVGTNEINTSQHQMYLDSDPDPNFGSYSIESSFLTAHPTLSCNRINGWSFSVTQLLNYYGKCQFQDFSIAGASFSCGCEDISYPVMINSYTLIPSLFQDVQLLTMVNGENELKWMYNNDVQKDIIELLRMEYFYKPVN